MLDDTDFQQNVHVLDNIAGVQRFIDLLKALPREAVHPSARIQRIKDGDVEGDFTTVYTIPIEAFSAEGFVLKPTWEFPSAAEIWAKISNEPLTGAEHMSNAAIEEDVVRRLRRKIPVDYSDSSMQKGIFLNSAAAYVRDIKQVQKDPLRYRLAIQHLEKSVEHANG